MPSHTKSLRQTNRNLRAQLDVLNAQLVQLQSELSASRTMRSKIDKISSEVVDSNPYSRLMALQRMGVVENYAASIQNYQTETGVAQPHQSGLSKVSAAAATLSFINPDVDIEAHNYNITLLEHYEHFLSRIQHGGKVSGQPVDLVLSCVDNFEARMTINKACNELNQVWFESGVSEDAMSCHIQLLYPGRTPCFECLPPLIVASGLDEKTLKREGVCAASLPTTMGLVASLLVQNSLKWLLNFGEVSSYVGYGAAKDSFYRVDLRPNPHCADNWCCRRQAERKKQLESLGLPANGAWNEEKLREAAMKQQADAATDKPKHDDNEFEIEVEPDSEPSNSHPQGQLLGEGVRTIYQPNGKSTDPSTDEQCVASTEESLEALMARMKQL
ncbi:ThiF family protein [Opisthorchis viverrini]|uniref:Ubiquitin-like modifier-activating enzyme 5 n=1 Tax=Opisthorchis viverrini TaxID=6198 RepID=A0A1S8WPL0_OPIVI|nr:ThiF family protein [Opisthorchis viverrini]